LHRLTGFPSVTLPCGHCALGLPAGLQISARAGDEATALRIAAVYERAARPDARPRVPRGIRVTEGLREGSSPC
jgi:Asp-tRNA(Asn)/Glu-tRNA(Gln) amidotransferase A subunit family amidase